MQIDPKLIEAFRHGWDVDEDDQHIRNALVEVLTVVYEDLFRHADTYRDTGTYRKHQDNRYQSDRGIRAAAFDRGYAKGIESAALDVMGLMGVAKEDPVVPIDQARTDSARSSPPAGAS